MRRKPKDAQTRGLNQQLNDIERGVENELKSDSKRGKRNNRHSSRKSKDRSSQSERPHFRGTNDPGWYALSPQLLKDSGSFSFNNPLGSGLDNVANNTDLVASHYTIPGAFRFDYIPTIGRSVDGTSAVNVAARRIYTFIRHANSGAANYDSPDLMLYLLAVKSCYEMYAQMVRAYGIVNVYAQTNRYLPDAVMHAAGFEPKEIRQNLADFRYAINNIAVKLNSLAIPRTMTLFKRSMWLTSTVFKDANTIKSQAIVPTTTYYWVYNETDSANGVPGFLEVKVAPCSTSTMGVSYKTWIAAIESQLNALLSSEDIGIMAGDILKAYGAANLYSVSGISEVYTVLPVYDEEFLLEFHNADLYRNKSSWVGAPPITQDQNGNILSEVYVMESNEGESIDKTVANQVLNAQFKSNRLMDVRTDSPNPEDVFVATRFKVMGYAKTTTQDGKFVYFLDSYCTEVPVIVVCYRNITDTNGNVVMQASLITGSIWGAYSFASLDAISKCDWMPYIYGYDIVMSGDAFSFATPTGIIGDTDNVTVIDKVSLSKIHQTALLSMFDVPSLASYGAISQK